MRAFVFGACALTLAGCRLNFDGVEVDPEDGVVAPPEPGTARVLVLGEDGEARAGLPVADAYVVAIEQDGSTRLVRTAADGTATIEVGGNTSIHIAFPREELNEWALSSFRAINDGASIVVGGRARYAGGTPNELTVALPAFPVDYGEVWITGPLGCLPESAYAQTPTVSVLYDTACEGRTVELFALAEDIYIPIGEVVLADGAVADRSSISWDDQDKVGVEYASLPGDIVAGELLVGFPTADGDVIPFGGSVDEVSGGELGLGAHLPPLVPDTIVVSLFDSLAGARMVFERVDEWPGNRTFDSSHLVAPITSEAVDTSTRRVAWSGASVAADAYWTSVIVDIPSTAFFIGATRVHWSAFGPAGATQVTYPELPAELGALAPNGATVWSTPLVAQVALSDHTYATALELLDRDLVWWWAAGAHLPAGNVAISATAWAED